MKMETSDKAPVLASNIVRVTIPASVAYNFDSITKVTQTVLGKLGCLGCHSGRDIRFIIEDDFRVDEKLNVFPNINTLGNEFAR
jgi:hypothetical protein